MEYMVEEAVIFAANAHKGAHRKNSILPYILHPMETMNIAASLTGNPEVLAAAALHDVVEDTPVRLSEIESRFGPYVASLVRSETEDKMEYETPEITWVIRKKESIDHLRVTEDQNVRILWLSDKLSNMRAIARDHEQMGDALFEIFHMKDPKVQGWYYHTIVELLRPTLADSDAWKELRELTERVFPEYAENP